MRKPVAAVTLAGVAVALTGAIAIAGHVNTTAAESARAARKAIEVVGGLWATPEHPAEPDVAWKFHVMKTDGMKSDVLLDKQFHVVDIRDQQVLAQVVSSDRTQGHRSDTDDSEEAVPTADADRAAQTALRAIKGGTVHDVDRESEDGATWEVEITTPEGKAVDVLIDRDFRVISVGGEREASEPADDEGRETDRDDDDRDKDDRDDD